MPRPQHGSDELRADMDPVSLFSNAVATAGLVRPKTIIPDGRLHRFSTSGRRSDTAGWYVYHPDGVPSGAFGCWRNGVSGRWCYRKIRELSEADRSEIRRRNAREREERITHEAEIQRKSREYAGRIWNRAKTTDTTHQYLRTKGVGAHGIRQAGDRLIIPLWNAAGVLCGLQFIDSAGNKRFLPGTAKRASFHVIGEIVDRLVLTEGYATGASVHEATGEPVVIAFDAGNLQPVAEALRQRCPAAQIVIAGDHDASGTGQQRAEAAAAAVAGIVVVPPEAGDWNDVFANAGASKVQAAFSEAFSRARNAPETDEAAFARLAGLTIAEYDQRRKQEAMHLGNRVETLDAEVDRLVSFIPTKQADILIELATSAELFHTPDGKLYADLHIDGHRETWPIRGERFRRWLERRFFQQTQGAPNSEAMKSALSLIEARARFEGVERQVFIRVAGKDGKHYLDLCDSQWQVVEIDVAGWRVIDKPPVRFRRAAGMQPLPLPLPGGSVDALRRFLNLKSDADFVLVIAWAVAVLRDRGPYPVLALSGEQGSAKSTFCAILRALLDPNTAPLRALPREDRDLFIAATNGHVLAFDNISDIPQWISDAFCRLSTGGGFAVRQLYTDGEEVLFDATRPILLNGIDDIISRPDLADRAVFISLEAISEECRRPEAKLWADFESERAHILGALLDAIVVGLKRLPETRLRSLPRMADFAIWATACEAAFSAVGTFSNAYCGNRDEAVEAVIEADPVAIAVRKFMETRTKWIGSATELFGLLRTVVDEHIVQSKAWPKSPGVLSNRIKRAAPCLRKIGIDTSRERDPGRKRDRATIITCKPKVPAPEDVGTQSSASSASSASAVSASPAGGMVGQIADDLSDDRDPTSPSSVRDKPLKNKFWTFADDADDKITPESGPDQTSVAGAKVIIRL